MYFQKKREVVVLLVVLLFLVASSILFFKTFGSNLTGAVVLEPKEITTQDIRIQGTTNIDTCQDLNITGELYRLTQSVSSAGTCFSIRNNSITLDCNRYDFRYDQGGSGTLFGFNNSGGYDNITIQNCNAVSSVGRGAIIYFKDSSNSTIINNNISGVGGDLIGIVLDNTSNSTVMNNNITLTGATSVGLIINGTRSNDNLIINNNFSIISPADPTAYSIMQTDNGTNYLIYNNSLAQINWTKNNLTTSTRIAIGVNVFLANNVVGYIPQRVDNITLNVTAYIQLKNLSYQNTPDLLKNGVRCDNSTDPAFRCNVTFDRTVGIAYANVTSFSNYSTEENDPPTVTINFPTNGSNVSLRVVNFSASVQDNFSAVNVTIFIFNNGTSPGFNFTAVNYSGIWNYSINTAYFAEGLQGFTVFANDSYNNINRTQFVNFTVDKSAPLVNTRQQPDSGDNIYGTSFTFNAKFTDNYTSVQSVNFQFSNGSGKAFNKTGTDLGSGIWEITGGVNTLAIMDSQVSFVTLFANDSVGNLNNSFTMNVTVDNTPPYVTITNPANWSNFSGTTTYNFNATIRNVSWVSDFPGESNIDTVVFQFSNSSGVAFNRTATNSSGTWNVALDLSTVTEGQSIMTVFAKDRATNMNNTQTINFIVDKTAPSVVFTSPTNGSNYSASASPTFRVTITDAFTAVQTALLMFNTNTTPTNTTLTNTSGLWAASVNLSLLQEGLHTVIAYANDTVNNVNYTQFINFTVDRTAPLVNITSHPSGTTISGKQVFNASITDNLLEVQTVIFQFSNGTLSFNRTAVNSSGSWNVSVETVTIVEGALNVTIFANDTVGNMNNTQILSLIVNNTPLLNSGGPVSETTPSESTTNPPPPAPSSAPESSSPTSETSSAAEIASAFESGEASVSLSGGKTGAYTSEQSYKLSITNNLKKKMILSGRLKAEDQAPLPNEENAIKRIKEELLLQGEADPAAVERELSILKLLENVEILQVFKTKLAHLLPSSLVNSVSLPLIPTGKHIEGNLLKDILLNAQELENLEINPGQTIEKEIKIRQGLSLDKKAPQIVFSSGGKQVLLRDIEAHRELLTGTAVDVNPKTKKLDFYIIIPPTSEGDKETFSVEMNINAKAVKDASSPFKLRLFGTQDVFSELYGPYKVNLKKGALLAVQYDASALPADYEVVGKVYKQGTDLVSENRFEIKG